MSFELFKPLIMRLITIVITALIAPALAKLQELGVFGAGETAQIVATVIAVLLAATHFLYQKLLTLAIERVSLALPPAHNQADLALARDRVTEAVRAEPLAGKLDIIRTGLTVGSGLTGGKTGRAFEIAAIIAEQLRRR